VAFPVQTKSFTKTQNTRSRVFPYEIRHSWRMMQQYVPEEKFRAVLLKLVRKKRIGYDTLNQWYCRL